MRNQQRSPGRSKEVKGKPQESMGTGKGSEFQGGGYDLLHHMLLLSQIRRGLKCPFYLATDGWFHW